MAKATQFSLVAICLIFLVIWSIGESFQIYWNEVLSMLYILYFYIYIYIYFEVFILVDFELCVSGHFKIASNVYIDFYIILNLFSVSRFRLEGLVNIDSSGLF